MKNKYWTIQYRKMDDSTKFVEVISMSITKAIAWVCEHEGISAEQIIYANGKEAELV